MIDLNINTGGIINKLKKNADWVAFLASVYARHGDLQWALDYYTDFGAHGALAQAQWSLSSMRNLTFKLFKSEQMYTGVFKISAIARLLAEFDIVPAKYKKLTEKLMWGSGLAAITLPGSGAPALQPKREKAMYERVVLGRGSRRADPMLTVYAR